ncbi:hypothetical protein HNQ77_004683 [Silvibacterium bohemicum]|uniref:Uncharacterized protein n=1 Tax=Silvibacterium bohemicum TaxID=1577686 RepID=A0A841K8U6_9BACT|nr:hypothetical protein [Silvibacterium bohemicum]MBB6146704.1 hypothetical protein [Silvibacterium bohemicum]
MTKRELLRLLLLQARTNGFDLRPWYEAMIDPEWRDAQAAVDTLARGHRYYALLFSHDFAKHFWKQGQPTQFVVPMQQFSRLNSRGETITITRKAYVRRTLKPHAWRYHLREMATLDEPLRYVRRFLVTPEEQLLAPLRVESAGALYGHPEAAG